MTNSPPDRSKQKLQTQQEFEQLQRLTASIIMRPLGRDMRTQTRWADNNPTDEIVGKIIKPNDRLTSLERVEIYNRQYWFRLIDCLYDDFPGLLAVVGQTRFDRLIRQYLAEHPSRSFTLRNLGSHLPEFIQQHPELPGVRRAQMALDMARFEWAQVVAFDGPEFPPITAADLAGKKPDKIRLGIQPFITLLNMHYPLDDFAWALKQQQTALRSEASNAMDESAQASVVKNNLPLPRPHDTFVAVHRMHNDLYFKRLDPVGYSVLISLAAGKTLAAACEPATSAQQVQLWFQSWTAMGWFCKFQKAKS